MGENIEQQGKQGKTTKNRGKTEQQRIIGKNRVEQRKNRKKMENSN